MIDRVAVAGTVDEVTATLAGSSTPARATSCSPRPRRIPQAATAERLLTEVIPRLG